MTLAKVAVPLLLVLLLLTGVARADRFCFSYAENYYEHIYCEIEASGQGKNLPGFYDFRRNNEMMQALLLKPFSRRIGIKLKLPESSSPPRAITTTVAPPVISSDLIVNCERTKNVIHCAGDRAGDSSGNSSGKNYRLVGNRSNQQLKSGMLSTSNRMNMPTFHGSLSDSRTIEHYLRKSYRHYLLKMLDIGLGGSTLSYGKFAFLFDDLNRRGVSFSERFETMYRYLKKDKQMLSVPAKSQAPDELTLADCYRLDNLLVCRQGMRNWLFLQQ